jgi:hypothetical protein
MLFTALALVAGTAAGLVTGGRPRHVGTHSVRAWWLLLAGFLLQAGVARLDLGPAGTVVLLTGYGCLLAFASFNRALIGMGVVALGLAANALVIGINGGMPVRPAAVVAAHITSEQGLPHVNYGNRHHPEGHGDRLGWLGDIVPIRQLHEVVSFGDLILGVGVGAVIAHLLHPRRRRLLRLRGPVVAVPPRYIASE